MKIIIAKSSGFCVGVRRAVEMALDASTESAKPVYTYGSLIHNPQVLNVLGKKEVHVLEEIPEKGAGAVLIRAHGIPPQAKEKLETAGFSVINATCPRVIKIQTLIKMHTQKGYTSIIIGDKYHPEVVGLFAHAGDSGHVVNTIDELESLPIFDKAVVVAQTTQNTNHFEKIKNWVNNRCPHYIIFDTICDSTEKRQEEVKQLAKTVDAIIVVGGQKSGNTRRLFEIAQQCSKLYSFQRGLLLTMSTLGLSYNLELLPEKTGWPAIRRIRDIPGSKTFLIATAWGVLTVVLPSLASTGTLSWTDLLILIWPTGLVIVRTTFFDILDMQGDRIVGKETIAILIGEQSSLRLLQNILAILTCLLPLASAFQLASSMGFSLLKRLSPPDLPALATEIRNRIIDVVSQRGGHLASSFGTVELAVALHYVFTTPEDKIIWDVGHQAYAHKLLTGRHAQFDTLRMHNGLSGFTRISEIPHDAFTTGHIGTSISAGLGRACGKFLSHRPGKVVVVIGDGSLTAGLAYEGLNQAGHLKKDLIIILNDNSMSIAPNMGALSSFLSRTFSAQKMQNFFKEFGGVIKSLPKVGDNFYQLAKRTKESFKTFVTPGMLFEAFNLEYFGPIDGHNLNHLVDILKNMRNLQGPLLLHVKTKKGKDYRPAEDNPVYFHGCGCFDAETGRCPEKMPPSQTYTDVFGCGLLALAKADERIVGITAAMPEGTGMVPFSRAYPNRFFDVGIAEQHAVTFAAGLALEGFKPVVAIYSTFLQRAYDQILHDVCLEVIPVVFAVDRGGIVGEDGPTHHGVFDLSYLRSLPNMVVMAPKDENELRRMLKTAIDHDGPIAVRYPRGRALGVTLENDIQSLPIGKAEILRKGEDLLILAIGYSVSKARLAHDRLKAQGIAATVVNSRFVKPLDTDLICALARTIPNIITVEENILQGGFGSAVLECLCDAGITGFRIARIGIPDAFVEHGPQDLLRFLNKEPIMVLTRSRL